MAAIGDRPVCCDMPPPLVEAEQDILPESEQFLIALAAADVSSVQEHLQRVLSEKGQGSALKFFLKADNLQRWADGCLELLRFPDPESIWYAITLLESLLRIGQIGNYAASAKDAALLVVGCIPMAEFTIKVKALKILQLIRFIQPDTIWLVPQVFDILLNCYAVKTLVLIEDLLGPIYHSITGLDALSSFLKDFLDYRMLRALSGTHSGCITICRVPELVSRLVAELDLSKDPKEILGILGAVARHAPMAIYNMSCGITPFVRLAFTHIEARHLVCHATQCFLNVAKPLFLAHAPTLGYETIPEHMACPLLIAHVFSKKRDVETTVQLLCSNSQPMWEDFFLNEVAQEK